MSDDRHEKIQKRAYDIWEREGGWHGVHERHWLQAEAEIDRETQLPDVAAETREIAAPNVATVEALAVRTGIAGDQAEGVLDRLSGERAAVEGTARSPRRRKGGR